MNQETVLNSVFEIARILWHRIRDWIREFEQVGKCAIIIYPF